MVARAAQRSTTLPLTLQPTERNWRKIFSSTRHTTFPFSVCPRCTPITRRMLSQWVPLASRRQTVQRSRLSTTFVSGIPKSAWLSFPQQAGKLITYAKVAHNPTAMRGKAEIPTCQAELHAPTTLFPLIQALPAAWLAREAKRTKQSYPVTAEILILWSVLTDTKGTARACRVDDP